MSFAREGPPQTTRSKTPAGTVRQAADRAAASAQAKREKPPSAGQLHTRFRDDVGATKVFEAGLQMPAIIDALADAPVTHTRHGGCSVPEIRSPPSPDCRPARSRWQRQSRSAARAGREQGCRRRSRIARMSKTGRAGADVYMKSMAHARRDRRRTDVSASSVGSRRVGGAPSCASSAGSISRSISATAQLRRQQPAQALTRHAQDPLTG